MFYFGARRVTRAEGGCRRSPDQPRRPASGLLTSGLEGRARFHGAAIERRSCGLALTDELVLEAASSSPSSPFSP